MRVVCLALAASTLSLSAFDAQERVLHLELESQGGPEALAERLRDAVGDFADPDGDLVTAQVRFVEPVSDLRAVQALPAPSFQALDLLDAGEAPEGDQPDDVEITGDGTTAVVLNRDSNNLTFLDLASDTVVATTQVGTLPEDLELTADGQYALVADTFSDTLSVVRLSDRALVAQVPVGVQPTVVRATADSATAYVGNLVDQSISVVDLGTLSVTATFANVPLASTGFSFTFESAQSSNTLSDFELALGDTVLVVEDAFADDLVFLDAATGANLGLYDVPGSGIGDVAISPSGAVATAAKTTSPYELHVVDVATRTALLTPTPLPTTALGSVNAITPSGSHTIVQGLNEVFVVDLASGALAATLSTGSVGDILFDAAGQVLYVANFNATVWDLATFALLRTISVATQQEAAISPVGSDVVGISRFGDEDLLHFQVASSGSSFVASTPSGEPAEGDAPRAVSITPDGTLAVVANNISDNVTLLDLELDAVVGHVDLAGDRIGDVEVTPDGTTAVVACIDTDSLAIVDLTTRSLATNVGTRGRPDQIAISSDGSIAYTATLNNGSFDYVSVVSVAGASSSLLGEVAVGQLGAAIAGNTVNSGLALTPDDAFLLVANSFDDDVSVIDTATLSVVASVPVGDFPLRIAISPDGQEAAVSNAFGDSISFLALNGAATSVVATVTDSAIDYPLDGRWTADGQTLFVGCVTSDELVAIDRATHTVAGSLDVGAPLEFELTFGDTRVWASTPGEDDVKALDLDGTTISEVGAFEVGLADPSGLDASDVRETAVSAVIAPDQILVVNEAWALPYGSGSAGAGTVPTLSILERPLLGTTTTLRVEDGAASALTGGYYSFAPAALPLPGGGTLLLAPPVFLGVAGFTDGGGQADLPVALPLDLSLAGTSAFLQFVVLESPGFALTQGLEVRLFP